MGGKRIDVDDEEVRFMYEVEGMSQQEIADYYGVCQATICFRLHPDKKILKKESNKNWRLKNPDKKKEDNDKFRAEHPEYDKQRYQIDKREEYKKEWWQTDYGKGLKRKINASRRGLGSIELSSPFPGSEFHHIDKEHGIHIPKELHRSIYHNLKTGQGMEEINAIAFQYITE